MRHSQLTSWLLMHEKHGEAHNILYCFQNPPNQQDLSFRSELAGVEYFYTRWNIRKLLLLSTGSSSVTSIVRTACDRDDARLRFVAPTDRCLEARLYMLLNSSTEAIDSVVRFATNTMPTSFSRTGSFGA
jgi:hypothetical protein